MSDDTLRIVRQPGNLLLTVQNMIDQRSDAQLFRATVVATTASTVRIERTGHDPDVAEYAVLDNFPYPRVGDEVLIAKVGAGWMVVGSVLRSGLTENYLKIETKLTLEPGGSIEDADGSVWDQTGITLKSLGVVTDTITINRATFFPEMTLQASIETNLIRGLLLLNWTDNVITSRDASWKGNATNLNSTTFSSLDVTNSSGQSQTAKLFADGRFVITNLFSNVNIGINGQAFGSGTGVVFIANASVVPSVNPAAGGILYVTGGALTYRGSGGTVTAIAPA